MKFVALVSGGKDSCYNILHCLKQGHELIALANLHPNDTDTQELNSFMFQTVGHDLVSLYENCCGVPLFRRPIVSNGSINKDLNYVKLSNNDEIETMYQLLNDVKLTFPDLEAVSVGAILSSYQRVRVEDVCNRLGLTVLSYLWQRDQLELMTEMCSMSRDTVNSNEPPCGHLDARLIKVATIGLDSSHLNKSLPEILPTMIKLNQRYEVNICGEGGEFETMVLDAPFFKKGYLELCDVVIRDEVEENDGVYNAELQVKFVSRELSNEFLSQELSRLPEQPLLGEKWEELLLTLKDSCSKVQIETEASTNDMYDCNFHPNTSITTVNNNLLHVSNLTSRLTESTDTTLETHTHDIFTQLEDILSSHNLYPCQIISSSLILQDISNFSQINQIYNEWFDTKKWGPLPPSRACVGSNILGPQNMVQLSVVIDLTKDTIVNHPQSGVKVNKNKDGLHVQGRSYWAPCNIGPYSQATWLHNDYENKVARISGQIALIPKSMTLVSDQDPWLQSVLALKHFDTLKQTIGTRIQLFMTCFVSSHGMVDLIAKTWSLYCSEMSLESTAWMDKEDDILESLIIVKISQLPRDALCEWGGVSCKTLEVESYDEDEYEDDGISIDNVNNVMKNMEIEERTEVTEILDTITVSKGNNKRYFTTGFSNNDSKLISFLQHNKAGHIVLYLNPMDWDDSLMALLYSQVNLELYPVQNVYNHKGAEYRYGFQYSY